MSQFIQELFGKREEKARLVHISILHRIRDDFSQLRTENDLNSYQHFIINEMHSLDLPDVDFKIKSILLVAAPSIARTEVNFSYQGQMLPVYLPATYADYRQAERTIENCLNESFASSGYHFVNAPRLPRKLLSVRSGLAKYGRNNITYVDGLGSFYNLNLYFTDMPAEEPEWCEIETMDFCRNCKVCQRSCPTQAILPDRFLIDNQRCLTYFNESGDSDTFPDWMDNSIHHTLVGCMQCQINCPLNFPYRDGIFAAGQFTEEETDFLLDGVPFDEIPAALQEKLNAFNMNDYFSAIPRNLRHLLANKDLPVA